MRIRYVVVDNSDVSFSNLVKNDTICSSDLCGYSSFQSEVEAVEHVAGILAIEETREFFIKRVKVKED